MKGFTLVELLITIAILGLVSAICAPIYSAYVERARQSEGIADLMRLDMQIERFQANSFRLPEALTDLGVADLTDPWGNEYQYFAIAGAGPGFQGKVRKDKNLVPINSDFDLYSSGPDGKSQGPLTAKASRDDLIRAASGGFFGVAAEY